MSLSKVQTSLMHEMKLLLYIFEILPQISAHPNEALVSSILLNMHSLDLLQIN